MNTKKGLLVLGGLMLILASCAKSKDEEPAPPFTADSKRAISEPRYSFTSDQQEIKLSGLSRTEMSEIMLCKEKSSKFRTDKKKYSVSYGTIVRSVNNGKSSIESGKIEYSTVDREEVYELTTTLNEQVISGYNVLENGAISYKDSCSVSAGCDQEKRKFLVGSPTYLINTKLKEEAVLEQVKRDKGTVECYLNRPTDETEQLQRGQIRMGDTTYKAVQVTRKKTGKIYCKAGASRQTYFLGEGNQTSKAIIVLDELLIPSKANLSLASSPDLGGCARTPIFSSEEIQFDGQTLAGASYEVADYKLQGETLSIEDWNKKQSVIKARVAELKDEAAVKKSKVDSAQLTVNEAENDLKAAESKVSEIKAKLAEAVANKRPDEEVFRTLVKDAETAAESARARRDSAKNLLSVAQTQARGADEAVAAYIQENGSGEN